MERWMWPSRFGIRLIRISGLRSPETAGHHGVADLVRRVRADFGGWGGAGCQPAIARAHRRAASLSAIPGKCRRSSTAAASSPLSSNTRRMISAVAASTLNMAPRWAGAPRPTSQTAVWLASNRSRAGGKPHGIGLGLPGEGAAGMPVPIPSDDEIACRAAAPDRGLRPWDGPESAHRGTDREQPMPPRRGWRWAEVAADAAA